MVVSKTSIALNERINMIANLPLIQGGFMGNRAVFNLGDGFL
jgi:hypothetical protein